MIVNLFRHTQAISHIIIFGLSILIWGVTSYKNPNPSNEWLSPFSENIFNWIHSNEILARIVTCLLVFYQCMLINRIAVKNKVLSITSSFPALFYFVLISASPKIIYFNAALVGITFILHALHTILSTYLVKDAHSQIFKSAFSLGIAAMIYPPFFVFIPLVWLGMSIFSQVEWRLWAISFLGIFCPYFLYYTLAEFFSLDQLYLSYFLESLFVEKIVTNINTGTLIFLVLGGLACLISTMELLSSLRQKNIQARKSFVLILWMLVIAFIHFYLNSEAYPLKVLVFAIPLSCIISNYYYYNKKTNWLNFLALVLFGSLMVNHMLK